MFILMQTFLHSLQVNMSHDLQTQKLLNVRNFISNDRTLSGIIETGEYGYESNLYNIENYSISYVRQTNEAEMMPFYFIIAFPPGENEGLIVLQRFGQNGIKTFFHQQFSMFVSTYIPNISVEINQLIPETLLSRYLRDGEISTIKFIKLGIPRTIEDRYDHPHEEFQGKTEVKISVKRPGFLPVKDLIREFLNGQIAINHFLELREINFEYDNVKVELVIDGKHRVIDLSNLGKINAYFDVTQEVVIGNNGHPIFNSIDTVAKTLSNEILDGIGIENYNVE